MPSPLVSVVIPTYNRPAEMDGCLRALAAQDLDRDVFEVIVVDDGSEPPVRPALPAGLRVTVLRQPNAGPAQARNTGARAASGTLLAFTDDDCRPAPDWLRQLVDATTRYPNALLGGRTTNALRGNLYSEASQWILGLVYELFNPDPEHARFFASNNILMPAAVFHRLGGFDQSFRRSASEDRELCDRWRHGGGRLVYVPEAVMHHRHELTLMSFWRQHFLYGQGAVRFHQIRAQRGSGRMRDEASLHLRWHQWLFRPLREGRGAQGVGLFALLFVWQIANAAGFFYESWRQRLAARQERKGARSRPATANSARE